MMLSDSGRGARSRPDQRAGDRQAQSAARGGDPVRCPEERQRTDPQGDPVLRDDPEELRGGAGPKHGGHQEHPHESAQRRPPQE